MKASTRILREFIIGQSHNLFTIFPAFVRKSVFEIPLISLFNLAFQTLLLK